MTMAPNTTMIAMLKMTSFMAQLFSVLARRRVAR
jgi:hypothetical protein